MLIVVQSGAVYIREIEQNIWKPRHSLFGEKRTISFECENPPACLAREMKWQGSEKQFDTSKVIMKAVGLMLDCEFSISKSPKRRIEKLGSWAVKCCMTFSAKMHTNN